MNSRTLVLCSVVLLTACPPPTPTPDGGSGVSPIITSISPSSGPLAGNTSVTLNGTNFVGGATVTFGGVPATTTFDSDRKLTALTPAGASVGPVNVTVTNPGGRANTLNNGFTYESNVTRTITQATLQNPADTSDSSGQATVNLTVIGHVEVPNVTAGTGAGAGVRAQVGFATTVGATPAQTDFTWADATYVGDVDGAASGDKARDSYSGPVALPGPTTTAQLIYFVAVRFSVDGGTTWTLADRDGSSNGVLTTQLARITVIRASVEWCKLGGEAVEPPPMLSRRGTASGPVVYGQVFKTGVTNMSGAGAGIRGALGYGAAGSDPSTWTWVDATFNVDTGSGANDEFQATLPNPGVGSYKFAFRFSHDNGPWSYCDADGLGTNGFTEDQAGSLTVQDVTIDSCKLQFPTMLASFEGRPTEKVYGRVFVQGLTEANGAAAGIEGQVGYGTGADPAVMSWVWSNATFNVDDGMGGEEYEARITGPTAGAYGFAYRFRVGSTGSWTYCDLDASTNGIQQAQLGTLTASAFDVSNCQLESANSAQTRLGNATTIPYSALITVPTLTDAAGQGTPLTVQLGYGATGTTPASWTWAAANFVNDAMAADRYQLAFNAPSMLGSYSVAMRVQVGARPFVYCDLDGSQNGFQDAQAGRLTVASALIQSCRIDSVSTPNLASGRPLTTTARVLIPTVTATAGAAPNLRVQIGNGPRDDASTSTLWGWQEATFDQDVTVTGEDQFKLTSFPAYSGNRAVSARASLDGVSWTYCDLNGSDVGGYEVNQQYDIVVSAHDEFDFCNLQSPATSARLGMVYGQLYEPGLTPNAAAPIIAQLGTGPETGDPGHGWSWTPATFNVLVGNNNEFQAPVPDAGVIGHSYAFRYTVDAGVWCYGDLNGSGNGFSGGANLGTIVP